MDVRFKTQGTKGMPNQNTHPAENNEEPMQHISEIHESLNPLSTNRTKLFEIKESLSQVLDATQKNLSLFTRASAFWGIVPLWQKAVAGIVLVVPLFLIGLSILPAVLITLSLILAMVYTVSSYLLDNHYEFHSSTSEKEKENIRALASVLETVIVSLDTLTEQLTCEMNAFKTENGRLKEQVTQLHQEIQNIADENEELKRIRQKLVVSQKDMEQTIARLNASIREQSELLNKNELALEGTKKHYEQKIVELSQQIVQLTKLNTELTENAQAGHELITGLQAVLKTTSSMITATAEQRKIFLDKLDEFITDKKKSVLEVASLLEEAAKKIANHADELGANNQRYNELLDQQEHLVERLSKITPQKLDEATRTHVDSAKFLKNFGIHAKKTPIPDSLSGKQSIPTHKSIGVY